MKKKLSGYIELRKGYEPVGAIHFWAAYWRGTQNRVKRENGDDVRPYTKQADLRFDLLNNPMENGVIA